MAKFAMHIAPLTRKAQLVYLVVGAVVASVLAFAGLHAWRSTPYFEPADASDPGTAAFDAAGVVGVIVFFTFAGLSIALLCECSQYFIRYTFHPANTGREWVAYQHAAMGAQAGHAFHPILFVFQDAAVF